MRKRVEPILGWMKMVGALHKGRYAGLERTGPWGIVLVGLGVVDSACTGSL